MMYLQWEFDLEFKKWQLADGQKFITAWKQIICPNQFFHTSVK